MKKGNILITAMIFVAICIVIILFIAAIFMSHVNSILYNLKLDMYAINKSAIISVNKNQTSMDDFSYNQKAYQAYFEKALKDSFHLNEKFENRDAMIESVKIVEYEIIEKGRKDSFTKTKSSNRVIHTVIEARIKPIIMRSFFEKIFTFTIHEDVNLNLAY
ncbi:MAG: hypothetical protein IJ220_07005 [Clostridia bacterium]|nr:hypothetical protein [Clostridia bacterium]